MLNSVFRSINILLLRTSFLRLNTTFKSSTIFYIQLLLGRIAAERNSDIHEAHGPGTSTGRTGHW